MHCCIQDPHWGESQSTTTGKHDEFFGKVFYTTFLLSNALLINGDIGTLEEDGVRVLSMVVVDLVRVVGDVTETENAMGAGDIWNGASDRKVGLMDHIHGRVIKNLSNFVSKVRRREHLVGVGANVRIKVAWLEVGPVVQVLLEGDGDRGSSLVESARILYARVTALVNGIGAITRGITYLKRLVSGFSDFDAVHDKR